MANQWAYLFRVNLYDDDFTIYRDVVLLTEQSLQDFLLYIRQIYGYDSIKDARANHCNDEWGRTNPIDLFLDIPLHDFISEPNQKFYYCYDLSKEFEFFIELLDIQPAQSSLTYPYSMGGVGVPPAQYSPMELKKMNGLNKNAILHIKSSLR